MKPTARSLLLIATACAALGAVFFLYTRPDFLVQLSNQLWACF